MVLGCAMAFLGGHPAEDLYWNGMYITIAGVIILVASRLPKILRGDKFSFGSSDLKRIETVGYYIAYILIFVGVIMQATAYLRISN